MKLSSFSKLNYLFVFWGIFENASYIIFKFSGTYIITFSFLVLLIFIPKSKEERIIFTKCLTTMPVRVWLVWVIYTAINWELKGLPPYDSLPRQYIVRYILPLAMMWVVYYEGSRNLKNITKVILYASIAYCLCGVLLQEKGGAGERNMGDLGNGLALNGCCLAFYACFYYVLNHIDKKKLYTILALSLAAIFFTSTRKAIGGWALILVSMVLPYINLKKPQTIVVLLSSVIIAYFSYKYIMSYTLLGSRMNEIDGQSERAYLYVNDVPEHLSFLGERLTHYLLGWRLFLEHPITGIGLCNFMYVSGFYVQLHTEYMVQLCEGGIIGFSLFASFTYGLFKSVLKVIKNKSKKISLVCIGGLLCVLFLGVTAWTYMFLRYFAIYGLILAYCNPQNKKQIL